jgi:hypothetical protein
VAEVVRRQVASGVAVVNVAVADLEVVRQEIANLQAAVPEAKPTDAFMTAALPGVIALFPPNGVHRTRLQRC